MGSLAWTTETGSEAAIPNAENTAELVGTTVSLVPTSAA